MVFLALSRRGRVGGKMDRAGIVKGSSRCPQQERPIEAHHLEANTASSDFGEDIPGWKAWITQVGSLKGFGKPEESEACIVFVR